MAQTAIEPRPAAPPSWWSPKGDRMVLDSYKQDEYLKYAKEGVASLTLRLVYIGGARHVSISWSIVHDVLSEEHRCEVSGTVLLTHAQAVRAFHVTRGSVGSARREVEDAVFASAYRADDGSQGLFVRQGRYLNIPGPGTGMQGDPNISFYIDDDVKAAVTEYFLRP